MKFKVAVAQINPALGDYDKNIKKHLKYIDNAIKKKADMVVFPELSLTGYSVKDLNFDLAINPYTSSILKPLKERSKKITIVCGGIEESTRVNVCELVPTLPGVPVIAPLCVLNESPAGSAGVTDQTYGSAPPEPPTDAE
jgi:predicted amidohydrolase